MPIKTNFFDHFVTFSSFVCSYQYVKKYDKVKCNSAKYVKTVKSSNKEKEVAKELVSVFVANHIGTLHYSHSVIVKGLERFFTAKNNVLSVFVVLLNSDKKIFIGSKTAFNVVYGKFWQTALASVPNCRVRLKPVSLGGL